MPLNPNPNPRAEAAASSPPVTPSQEGRFLRFLMEHFPDRIYFKDLKSRIIYGSKSFARQFGLEDAAELVGKTDFDYFSEAHAKSAYEDEQEIIRTGEPKPGMEEQLTWPDGRVAWCSTTKAAFRDDQGRIIGTFGISRDITVRKQAQEALRDSEARYRQVSEQLVMANRQLAEANRSLQDLALTDPLTGLRNRRFLTACMPEDIAAVERSHRTLASIDTEDRVKQNVDLLFLMVDLDHFKKVNDHHGHLAGDRVLQQVGEILCRSARSTDTVARVGGEEFLVVARQAASTDSQVMAERIRAAVEAHPFDIGENAFVHCTCSVGFSVYPLLGDKISYFTWEQVVEIADQCLYAVKHGGRNGWVGIIPDQESLRLNGQPMPEDIPALVRAGILPTISSLHQPVRWDAEEAT